jgi:hypothetical protein
VLGPTCVVYLQVLFLPLLRLLLLPVRGVIPQGLQKLNAVGYGLPDTGLKLDLVYNPGGPFLAPPQSQLEPVYKQELKEVGSDAPGCCKAPAACALHICFASALSWMDYFAYAVHEQPCT